mmetsp:Transcript_3001/g.10010  ORF Transcript_3001/g.10010 Transcript_3001/m.10010 type:complete len:342 (-) Transcript_3001:135-1160(-)
MPMMFETNLRDVKDEIMSKEVLSEEETATQTPRSTSDSFNESSIETPRSSAKSGDTEEEYDDGSCQEDEYYAFLRELAGSFEQEDSGSEGGSDAWAGPEEEDEESGPPTPLRDPPLELGSSGLVAAECGRSTPRLSPACGQACQGGGGHGAGSPAVRGTLEEGGRRRLSSRRGGSRSREASPSSYDERCCVPSPNLDRRGPVQDDYDVVQAVQEFAANRRSSRLEQQKEDLQALILQKTRQAQSLSGVASSPHVGLSLREHYSHVREELLQEAQQLETELVALVEEAASAHDADTAGNASTGQKSQAPEPSHGAAPRPGAAARAVLPPLGGLARGVEVACG